MTCIAAMCCSPVGVAALSTHLYLLPFDAGCCGEFHAVDRHRTPRRARPGVNTMDNTPEFHVPCNCGATSAFDEPDAFSPLWDELNVDNLAQPCLHSAIKIGGGSLTPC